MFIFGFKNWLRTRLIRIIIISAILILASLFARSQVGEFFSLAGLLFEGSKLTIADYLMGMLNMPQFFMFFLFPVLFSILIADLLTDDFVEGYALFILTRIHYRMQYILSKLFILLVASLFFMLLVLLVSMLTWLLMGTPITGETFHYVFVRDSQVGISIVMTWLNTLFLFTLGIFFIGIITLTITIYTGKPSLAVGIMIIVGFIHNGVYMTSENSTVFLPFSQYMIGIHNEYAPFGFSFKAFEVANSYFYLIIISIILAIAIIMRFKNKDLYIGYEE